MSTLAAISVVVFSFFFLLFSVVSLGVFFINYC